MTRANPGQAVIDFEAAMAARDVGIERAVAHADAVESQWSGMALGMLVAFVNEAAGPFLIEEARAWAEAHELPPPPDARSWGAVTRRAAAKRLIRKVGFRAAASSNCSPKVLWEKNAA